MRETPILFSAPMVAALLNTKPNVWPAEPIDPGKPFKSQTRRIIKHQPDSVRPSVFAKSGLETHHGYEIKCPYEVGQRLWVKETYAPFGDDDYFYRADGGEYTDPCIAPGGGYPSSCRNYPGCEGCTATGQKIKWKSSRFMPKIAARIWLEVKDRRLEKIQDISEFDIIAEGCPLEYLLGVNWYRPLWDSLHGKGVWKQNDYVWVYEFMRVDAP